MSCRRRQRTRPVSSRCETDEYEEVRIEDEVVRVMKETRRIAEILSGE